MYIFFLPWRATKLFWNKITQLSTVIDVKMMWQESMDRRCSYVRMFWTAVWTTQLFWPAGRPARSWPSRNSRFSATSFRTAAAVWLSRSKVGDVISRDVSVVNSGLLKNSSCRQVSFALRGLTVLWRFLSRICRRHVVYVDLCWLAGVEHGSTEPQVRV